MVQYLLTPDIFKITGWGWSDLVSLSAGKDTHLTNPVHIISTTYKQKYSRVVLTFFVNFGVS